ncbi:hypothetical protein SO802_031665 [Lithocarpus litseifolius]|uniref:Uncharacterized protein n=1 Tax=Lithocarpus litseifolius TaxID=425828 RepID=A0AAW2BP78_9ROSI
MRVLLRDIKCAFGKLNCFGGDGLNRFGMVSVWLVLVDFVGLVVCCDVWWCCSGGSVGLHFQGLNVGVGDFGKLGGYNGLGLGQPAGSGASSDGRWSGILSAHRQCPFGVIYIVLSSCFVEALNFLNQRSFSGCTEVGLVFNYVVTDK